MLSKPSAPYVADCDAGRGIVEFGQEGVDPSQALIAAPAKDAVNEQEMS